MFGWIAAIISGTLMSIQGVFNTEATKQTGAWLTNSFVQISGFFLCFLIWYFREKKNHPVSSLLSVEPRYYLLGGIIGAFITFTVISSMSSLGPAKAVMLIVAAQLIVAYLIEVFGMFGVPRAGFDWMKLLGTGLFLAGIFVFKARG
ncbi:MAG: DMT family transporter [Lachnospiraceae bacterium]|nr:DMT family transporter [Lachnospiraceae bacterium]MDY5497665.1 DMT family transporter [Anaerobutyricum sp.]